VQFAYCGEIDDGESDSESDMPDDIDESSFAESNPKP